VFVKLDKLNKIKALLTFGRQCAYPLANRAEDHLGMTDPTVEAYERYQPIDEIVGYSHGQAEVARAMEQLDQLEGELADSIPTSAAGLRIHCDMIERYHECADDEADRRAFEKIRRRLYFGIVDYCRSVIGG
jgi:hypothetical protein